MEPKRLAILYGPNAELRIEVPEDSVVRVLLADGKEFTVPMEAGTYLTGTDRLKAGADTLVFPLELWAMEWQQACLHDCVWRTTQVVLGLMWDAMEKGCPQDDFESIASVLEEHLVNVMKGTPPPAQYSRYEAEDYRKRIPDATRAVVRRFVRSKRFELAK